MIKFHMLDYTLGFLCLLLQTFQLQINEIMKPDAKKFSEML